MGQNVLFFLRVKTCQEKTVPGMYKIIGDAGENILVDHGICLSMENCMRDIRVRDLKKLVRTSIINFHRYLCSFHPYVFVGRINHRISYFINLAKRKVCEQ